MARKTVGIRKRSRLPAGREEMQAAPGARSPCAARNHLWISRALAVATLAVYAQVLGHQFITLDDDLYIRDNLMVARGLTPPGIVWAFTTFHAANWHPLTWLSHMLDAQLFGLNAGGHLIVNALLHTANTLLVFWFLKRVTGAQWRSAMVAALFALHPLHVESVAWAAERKDTLAAFFGLLTLLAYARYVKSHPSSRAKSRDPVAVMEGAPRDSATPPRSARNDHRKSREHYALVALWLALGLMAKPMLVTWPFVLLLLDYWPLSRLEWRPADGIVRFTKDWLPLVREKVPLFCLVIPSMIVTHLAQTRGGAMADLVAAPLSWRLANSLISYVNYLRLTFWPTNLAVYYPVSRHAVPTWEWIAALVLLGAITAVALRSARERPYLITGWLWFLGTLVPVIGLVRVGAQAMADRYMYIPSIGLFVALVFGVGELANTWRIGRIAIAAASGVILLILTSLTVFQIGRWRDSETLFTHTLSVTADNLVIQSDLGAALAQQKKYADAVPHFAEALRIKPTHVHALLNMGMALRKQGQAAAAVGFFERASTVAPNDIRGHWQLGQALAEQGKNDAALPQFLRAAELSPNDFDLRMDLALALTRQNKLAEAISQLTDAVRLRPDSAEAHNNLGLVLLMAGQPEQSLPHFSAALRLKPDYATAQDNLKRAQNELAARRK